MRRFKQALSTEEIEEILKRNTSGVLALIDEKGFPYAVPLSYVLHENCLYFHGAKTGHKMKAMLSNPKASFCVIDQDQVVSKHFTTFYRSAIVFGMMRIIDDPKEKEEALLWLCKKYFPLETQESVIQEINKFPNVCLFVLDIESWSGKKAKELI